MITFFRYIKSDLIKIAKPPMLLMHIIVPVLSILLFASGSNISRTVGLISSIFPFLTAIICAIISNEEACAGNFQQMLTSYIKFMPFLSKLTVMLLFGFGSILIFIFGLGFYRFPFHFVYYLYCACILFINSIFFYVLNFIISLRFVSIQTITAGIFEVFLTLFFTSNVKWTLSPCIIRTGIIIILAWMWFSRWEGNKSSDK